MTFLDHFSHTITTDCTIRYKLTTCSFIRKYLFSGEEASGIIMTTRHESEKKQGGKINRRITIVTNPKSNNISHIKLKPSEMLADVRLKEADCEGSDPAGISCLAPAQAPAPEQWEIIGRN